MSMPTSEHWHQTPFFRFLVVGGTNTAATAAIVVVLSFFLPGWLAFTIAFALGLVYSVLLTGRWVFSSRLTLSRTFLFIGAYLIIYFAGLGFVAIVGMLDGPPWLNGASVFFTAPLSFIAGKFIFTNPQSRQVTHA
jgi:putative flippase GtrA